VQLVKVLCSTIHFPKKVSDYLVGRFPELVPLLVYNEQVEASSFAPVPASKQSADTAVALLGLNNPDAISEWCKSRDKRQGTCDQVLRSWHLPLASQLDFVSKALTEDSARSVLLSDWFSDKAKLIAASRADSSVIWQWLASDPVGLSDEEWVKAMCLASSKLCYDGYAPMYAALIHRPHLAQHLLESDSLAAVLATSMVPWIDPALALERLGSYKSETYSVLRIGLIPFLDHPSLPTEFRTKGFALAAGNGLMPYVSRAGCPSPGSALDIGQPLGSLTDPLLVELVASRSLLTPHRVSQLVQLAAAPAAGLQVLARASEAPRSVLQGSIGFIRPLVALASRIGDREELGLTLPNHVSTVSDFEASVRMKALVGAMEKPKQHTVRRYRYTHQYGSSEYPDLTVEAVLDSPLEELAGKISGYRIPLNASEVATETIISKLGSGDSERSLSAWENFFQILPRTNAKIKFRQVLTSSVKLV